MMFLRNSNSQLTLEEQKLKLLIIITDCEKELERVNQQIQKNNVQRLHRLYYSQRFNNRNH